MQVCVETCDGCQLPPGCHVGIRVGEMLKQGKYEPHRSYHFPPTDRRRHAKIDIFQHVGSCTVTVDPEVRGRRSRCESGGRHVDRAYAPEVALA